MSAKGKISYEFKRIGFLKRVFRNIVDYLVDSKWMGETRISNDLMQLFNQPSKNLNPFQKQLLKQLNKVISSHRQEVQNHFRCAAATNLDLSYYHEDIFREVFGFNVNDHIASEFMVNGEIDYVCKQGHTYLSKRVK